MSNNILLDIPVTLNQSPPSTSQQSEQLNDLQIYEPVLRYYSDVPKCYSITNDILNITNSRFNTASKQYECNEPGYTPLFIQPLYKRNARNNNTDIIQPDMRIPNTTNNNTTVDKNDTIIIVPKNQTNKPIEPDNKPTQPEKPKQQIPNDNQKPQKETQPLPSYYSKQQLFFGLIALFVVIMIVVFGCRAITRLLRQSKKSKQLHQQHELEPKNVMEDSNIQPNSMHSSNNKSAQSVDIQIQHESVNENNQQTQDHFHKQ